MLLASSVSCSNDHYNNQLTTVKTIIVFKKRKNSIK